MTKTNFLSDSMIRNAIAQLESDELSMAKTKELVQILRRGNLELTARNAEQEYSIEEFGQVIHEVIELGAALGLSPYLEGYTAVGKIRQLARHLIKQPEEKYKSIESNQELSQLIGRLTDELGITLTEEPLSNTQALHACIAVVHKRKLKDQEEEAEALKAAQDLFEETLITQKELLDRFGHSVQPVSHLRAVPSNDAVRASGGKVVN